MLTSVSWLIIKLLLWTARGSEYWQDKWLGEERNPTNRVYMRNYLLRAEMDQICFLRACLCNYGKVCTKWEKFRLLAVMEAVNNSSWSAQSSLEELVSPFQAGKLGMERIVDLLVELLSSISGRCKEETKLREVQRTGIGIKEFAVKDAKSTQAF